MNAPRGEQLLAVLGPGEIVGEMALVDAAPRSASVRAREASVLLPITTGQIRSRLAGADPVLRLLLDTVLVRFRSTLHQLGGRVLAPREMPDNDAVKAAALAQLATARELALAIQNGEIVVHYQPIVDLADGRVVALEALTRWQHAVRGLIPPVIFVPVAEANDLSAALAIACVPHRRPRLSAAPGCLRGIRIVRCASASTFPARTSASTTSSRTMGGRRRPHRRSDHAGTHGNRADP